jgi:hypothetical protein
VGGGGWLGVAVGDERAGDDVGEDVGCATAVHVGVPVLVGVGVQLGVVELIGVALGVLVSVGTGWLPIRTTI